MPRIFAQKFHVDLYRQSLKETIKDIDLVLNRLTKEKAFIKEMHGRLAVISAENKEIVTKLHKLKEKVNPTEEDEREIQDLEERYIRIQFLFDDKKRFY